MTDDKKKESNVVEIKKHLPPENYKGSKQLDLFSLFLKNKNEELTNTIEFWDSIPKYILNKEQQKKLRPKEGQPDPYEYEYTKNGYEYKVITQPALIKQDDGSYKAFFPSVTEELIEEVLKKFLSEQNALGIHEEKKGNTWVKFTIFAIQKELNKKNKKVIGEDGVIKEKGKSRSYKEIKQSLEILSKSIITVKRNNVIIWNSPILEAFSMSDSEQYKKESERLSIAKLSSHISNAIDNIEYRQANYLLLMGLNTSLSRWLYRKMIFKVTNSPDSDSSKKISVIKGHHKKPYNLAYSTIKKESGLLQAKEEHKNRAKMIEALEELKREKVIYEYKLKEHKEGRTIKDVIYYFEHDFDFGKEQKRANKRQTILIKKSKKDED